MNAEPNIENVEEISAKLVEIANSIRASGVFAPSDVTAAFLTAAALNAINDIGPVMTVDVFRNYADAIENRQLRGMAN